MSDIGAAELCRSTAAARSHLTLETYVGCDANANGVIDFGAGGGTLTTRSLFVSPQQMTGSGNISTNGIVSDFDLVFDADHTAKPNPCNSRTQRGPLLLP